MIFLIWFYLSLLLCCGFAWAMADDFCDEQTQGKERCKNEELKQKHCGLLLADGTAWETRPAAHCSKPATPTIPPFQLARILK